MNAPAVRILTPTKIVKVSEVRPELKPRGCDACGSMYSSPKVQHGTRHRGCRVSPAGRFRIARKA